jgi:cytochrome b
MDDTVSRFEVASRFEEVASRFEEAVSRFEIVSRIRRRPVRVWDMPTRVFHWSLLVCVVGAVTSAQLGGNWMEWHLRFGVATLGLLVFRIVWGVVGPRYARFRSFLFPPRVVLAHLKEIHSERQRHAGHSPSGAVAVFALLGVFGAQALSGLLSSDSIGTDGPLARFVSESTVNLATSIHLMLQWAIYSFVALHVVAVVAYLVVKKHDLIRPMVHGDKPGIRAPHADDSIGVRIAGLALMLGSVAGAAWLFRG